MAGTAASARRRLDIETCVAVVDPQAMLSQGRAQHLVGRFGLAAQLYDQALALQPHDAELLHLRGALAWQLGQLELASVMVNAALVQRPNFAPALNTCGVIAKAQGKLTEAEAAFTRAYALSPRSTSFAANLASALIDGGDKVRALAILRDLACAQPDCADAQRALGDALVRVGQPHLAIAYLRNAVCLADTDPEHRFVLAHANQLAGEPGEAVPHYEHILARHPDHSRALQNLGRAYSDTGEHERSFACLRQAVALVPDSAENWANLAVALRRRGELDAALAHYAKAIALDPQNPRTRYHHSLTLLLAGAFDRGWLEHEWRIKTAGFPVQRALLDRPLWNGGPLAGRTLLLHAEQGLGDTLQFIRYATLIGLSGLAHGSRIVLLVQPGLVPVVTGLAGVDIVVGTDEPLPPFDTQAPLLSLPLLMRTSIERIPAAVPYLHADTTKRRQWQNVLGHHGLRVGLVWSGNPGHGNDRERSLPPERVRELAERLFSARPDLRLFGLQLGARMAELDGLTATGRYTNLSEHLTSFAETAAVAAALDAVVSVDTSVAHLAGALARPVIVLLPFAPDWRWLQAGSDTPWYPTMRLCRAGGQGDMSAAIAKAVDLVTHLPLPTAPGARS